MVLHLEYNTTSDRGDTSAGLGIISAHGIDGQLILFNAQSTGIWLLLSITAIPRVGHYRNVSMAATPTATATPTAHIERTEAVVVAVAVAVVVAAVYGITGVGSLINTW